jgi:hypothetical protein
MRYILALAFAVLAMGRIAAQSAPLNLLSDPSFEGETWDTVLVSPNADTFLNVPQGWRGGALTTPTGVSWRNVYVNGYPHAGDSLVYDGERSLHLSRGGGQWTAWVSQTVDTVPNTLLEGGAWAYILHARNQGFVRVGIDPMGNNNPFSSTVIWGEPSGIPTYWHKVSVTAQATGRRATLFLFAYQDAPADPNSVYWDAAFLVGEGVRPSIVPLPPTSAPPTQLTVSGRVIASVRAGASFASERIGRLSQHTRYLYLGREGQWVKVAYMGQEGYVLAGLVVIHEE